MMAPIVNISMREFKDGMAEKKQSVKMSEEMRSFVYKHAQRPHED